MAMWAFRGGEREHAGQRQLEGLSGWRLMVG